MKHPSSFSDMRQEITKFAKIDEVIQLFKRSN